MSFHRRYFSSNSRILRVNTKANYVNWRKLWAMEQLKGKTTKVEIGEMGSEERAVVCAGRPREDGQRE
jgi:hypothetical protein